MLCLQTNVQQSRDQTSTRDGGRTTTTRSRAWKISLAWTRTFVVNETLTVAQLALHHGRGGRSRGHGVIEVTRSMSPALTQPSRSRGHTGTGRLKVETHVKLQRKGFMRTWRRWFEEHELEWWRAKKLTAGRSDCMFWLESAIVAKYTRFLCRICWYLSTGENEKCSFTLWPMYSTVTNVQYKAVWWGKDEKNKRITLTVCIRPSSLCFGNPLYTVLNDDFHPTSFGRQ